MTRDGSGVQSGLGIVLRPERNTGYGTSGDDGTRRGYGDGFGFGYGFGYGYGSGKGQSSWGFWLHGHARRADDVWRRL